MSRLQLLAFHFPPGAAFEGRLVGALERTESGGALRILDTLFVASEPGTGELVAVATHGSRLGGEVASLLRFRLEPAERRRATERALQAYARDGAPNPLEAIHARLEPGRRSPRRWWSTCGGGRSTTRSPRWAARRSRTPARTPPSRPRSRTRSSPHCPENKEGPAAQGLEEIAGAGSEPATFEYAL